MFQCWVLDMPVLACFQDLVLPSFFPSQPSCVLIPMLGVSAVQKGATEVQILYELSDGLAKSSPNGTGRSQGKTCCVITQNKVITGQST